MKPSHNTGIKNRVLGLDILRAMAILLVVFGHGKILLRGSVFENFPYFLNIIDGVDIFFVLSGFLIGNILLAKINNGKTFNLRELLIFWKRRWFRTLPNYYLFLLINYLLTYFGVIHSVSYLSNFSLRFFIFLQNFSKGFYDFFMESWSLSVEEWFYILSPLALVLLIRFFPPKKSFLLVACTMLALPFLYRLHLSSVNVDDFWFDQIFRRMVLTRLDSISCGLLAAWVYFYYNKLWRRLKFPGLFLAIVLLYVLVHYQMPNNSFYKQVIYFSLSPIAVMFLLPFFETIKTSKNIIAKIFTQISIISYSMYLVNYLAIQILADNFLKPGTLNTVENYAVYWIIVIGLSTLVYRYFEKPMTNLRDYKLDFYKVSKRVLLTKNNTG